MRFTRGKKIKIQTRLRSPFIIKMNKTKITAFPDGNSKVLSHASMDNVIVSNSEGLVKVFDPSEPELEPLSFDVADNTTFVIAHGSKLLVTNTGGTLELVDISELSSTKSTTAFRSQLPLRAAAFINEGKRFVCGGDDNKLVVTDLKGDPISITLEDQLLHMSYNITGELLALSLANGSVEVYLVLNELPRHAHSITGAIPARINSSLNEIDYNGEHEDELEAATTEWLSDGSRLFVLSAEKCVVSYLRSDWEEEPLIIYSSPTTIVDFKVSPTDRFVAILRKDSTLVVVDCKQGKVVLEEKFTVGNGLAALNVAWRKDDIYVGTSAGEILLFGKAVNTKSDKQINSLFLDEAEEDSDAEFEKETGIDKSVAGSDGEEDEDEDEGENDLDEGGQDGPKRKPVFHAEDSMVIDEEDDEFGHYAHVNKRLRPSRDFVVPKAAAPIVEELKPYSPGSTPWTLEGKEHSTVDRRYLCMNSIGYVWVVRNRNNEEGVEQQTVTVSFFDRSHHKDYHFVDYTGYDICSLNNRGILLAVSGYKDPKATNNGKIYYRNHDSEQDSWERPIPLLRNEYMTCASITESSLRDMQTDAVVVVGTSFGYLRFFNLFGVCVNLMKVCPVASVILSSRSVLFMINQLSGDSQTYSIIDAGHDYRYMQQNVPLPVHKAKGQFRAVKGLFFSELQDPCMVSGADDTVMVLQSWREPQNSRWVPVLNCHDVITEYGQNPSKSQWKSWPLGMYNDQLACLVLKDRQIYPGFPLPLPVELEIRMPIAAHEKPTKKKNSDILDELNDNEPEKIIDKEDPEEMFLRALTMGKIVSESLGDSTNEEEHDAMLERLTEYSVVFDRSLLRLFGAACKESRLNRALSIARLIKTDKALLAATKIAQRLLFNNLASKIGELRQELVSLSDSE